MTITQSITGYKQELTAIDGFSSTTVSSYVNAVKSLSVFTSNTDITLITNKTLRSWLINLREQGVSQNSTNTYVVAIRRYIRFINEYGAVVDMNAIKPPKRKEVKVDYIGDLEVEMLIEHCDLLRDKAIIATLYTSGIRNSELCGLRIIDFRDGQLNIMGKGSKPRTVFINDYARRLIFHYLRSRDDLCPYLFTTDNKGVKPIKPPTIRMILRQASESSGVHSTPHTLRHSFASTMIRNGMNTRHVQYLLGHAKLETTQRYTHIQPVDIKQSYRGKMPLNVN